MLFDSMNLEIIQVKLACYLLFHCIMHTLIIFCLMKHESCMLLIFLLCISAQKLIEHYASIHLPRSEVDSKSSVLFRYSGKKRRQED